MKLKDKVCIITGATSGMGKAIAESFHTQGAKLVLSGRNLERGEALAKKMEGSIFVSGDVSQAEYNETLVRTAIDHFGKLDILSLNAGILGLGNVVDLPLESWQNTLNTNLSSIFYLSKYAIPHLQKSGQGNILINASIAAFKSFPNHPAYCASKGASVALMKQKLSIIKIGGNVIEDVKQLHHTLSLFSKIEGHKILIHGGGKKATQIAKKLGIESKMVNGRRITDSQSLDIAIMIYGGLVNKKIVAQLQSQQCNALGMSGADCNTIKAHKRPVKEVDFGWVGDVDGINSGNISKLLRAGFTPVFCALTHDGQGQLLNTNADTIASELSIGMSSKFETTLYYCFEKKGVLQRIKDENSVIQHIDSKKYEKLLSDGIITDGMLPKMHNCFHALQNNVKQVCIGDSSMLQGNNSNFTTLTL